MHLYFVSIIFILFEVTAAKANSNHLNISSDLKVKKTPYYNKTLDIIQNWDKIKPKICTEAKNGIHIRAWTLPEHETYVSLGQLACISTPIETAFKLLMNFQDYSNLYPGLKEVKILSQNKNEYLLNWHSIVPVFFIPNFQYKMTYVIESLQVDRKIFRYHLKEGEKIKASDGVIILQKLSEYLTLYFEIDFYDADWGILKSVSTDKIWSESIKGLFYSDLAFKFKAENTDWSSSKARETAEKKTDKLNFDSIIEQKKPYNGLQSIQAWFKTLN